MNIGQEIEILQQIVLEDTYSRTNIRKRIKKEVLDIYPQAVERAVELITEYVRGKYYPSKEIRLKQLLTGNMSYEEIALEIFTAVLPEKEPTRIQNIAALIGVKLDYDNVFDGIKTASELLAVIRSTGLYDIYRAGTFGIYMTIRSNHGLSKETLEYLDRAVYLPPMICKPKEWDSNYGAGHITIEQTLLLGRDSHHNEYQNYDAINTLQDIALELDPYVLGIKEYTKKDLSVRAQRQFNQQAVISKKIYNYYKDFPFYFVWKYDKRGRMYSQGYHINIQSYAYKKSLINLAKKELIV